MRGRVGDFKCSVQGNGLRSHSATTSCLASLPLSFSCKMTRDVLTRWGVSSWQENPCSGRGPQEGRRAGRGPWVPAGGLPALQRVWDLLAQGQEGGCQTHRVGGTGAQAGPGGQLRPHDDVQAGQGAETHTAGQYRSSKLPGCPARAFPRVSRTPNRSSCPHESEAPARPARSTGWAPAQDSFSSAPLPPRGAPAVL